MACALRPSSTARVAGTWPLWNTMTAVDCRRRLRLCRSPSTSAAARTSWSQAAASTTAGRRCIAWWATFTCQRALCRARLWRVRYRWRRHPGWAPTPRSPCASCMSTTRKTRVGGASSPSCVATPTFAARTSPITTRPARPRSPPSSRASPPCIRRRWSHSSERTCAPPAQSSFAALGRPFGRRYLPPL